MHWFVGERLAQFTDYGSSWCEKRDRLLNFSVDWMMHWFIFITEDECCFLSRANCVNTQPRLVFLSLSLILILIGIARVVISIARCSHSSSMTRGETEKERERERETPTEQDFSRRLTNEIRCRDTHSRLSSILFNSILSRDLIIMEMIFSFALESCQEASTRRRRRRRREFYHTSPVSLLSNSNWALFRRLHQQSWTIISFARCFCRL